MQSTGAKLVCPDCGSTSATLGPGIELLPDSWNDEISLGCVSCAACSFKGIAVYRESRAGRLDAGSWSQAGYRMGDDAWEQVRTAIAQCPEPDNRRCRCASHLSLGAQNPRGGWDWLAHMDSDPQQTFAIRLLKPEA